MHCKNCHESLEKDAQFCNHCGAKVIVNRITFRFLMGELFAVFGLDNAYFTTLRKMIVAPHEVLHEYLHGVRKRYMAPLTFLAVGAAISLLVFNLFFEQYLELQDSLYAEQNAALRETASRDLTKLKNISATELASLQKAQQSAKLTLNIQRKTNIFFVKYLNITTFLLLPFYALISLWTYRKPYNFGEHIIMNAYILGTTMYISIFLFLVAIYIYPKMFMFSIFGMILYYTYVFRKLYGDSVAKTLVKILRFLVVLSIILILTGIVTAIIGIVAGIIIYFTNFSL